MKFLDQNISFEDQQSSDQHLVIKRHQEIPQSFLDRLKEERMASVAHRAREFHRVASIPTAVVDKWAREGFDIHQETAPRILAKLRSEDLQAFITTEKAI